MLHDRRRRRWQRKVRGHVGERWTRRGKSRRKRALCHRLQGGLARRCLGRCQRRRLERQPERCACRRSPGRARSAGPHSRLVRDRLRGRLYMGGIRAGPRRSERTETRARRAAGRRVVLATLRIARHCLALRKERMHFVALRCPTHKTWEGRRRRLGARTSARLGGARRLVAPRRQQRVRRAAGPSRLRAAFRRRCPALTRCSGRRTPVGGPYRPPARVPRGSVHGGASRAPHARGRFLHNSTTSTTWPARCSTRRPGSRHSRAA